MRAAVGLHPFFITYKHERSSMPNNVLYYIASSLRLPRSKQAHALNRIREAVEGGLVERHRLQVIKQYVKERHKTLVDLDLEEMLVLWEWDPAFEQGTGDLVKIHPLKDYSSDENQLFELLAPDIDDHGFVELENAENRYRVYFFRCMMHEQVAEYTYPPPEPSTGKIVTPPYLIHAMDIFASRVLEPLLFPLEPINPRDGNTFPSLEPLAQIISSYYEDEHVERAARSPYQKYYERTLDVLLPVQRLVGAHLLNDLGMVIYLYGSFEDSWLANEQQALDWAVHHAEQHSSDLSIQIWYVACYMEDWRRRAARAQPLSPGD
jgi:hypothetical protein